MKLYTMPISQPARAVMWAMAYEGTACEMVQVMPGKDTRKPEFMKMSNLMGTVPCLDDGGFVVSESHAILTYLAEKQDWSLYPSSAEGRARVQQYFNWHHRNTREITLSAFAPALRPDLGLKPKPVPKATLDTLESWLGQSAWLCGEAPTLADLSCFCEVGQCQAHFCDMVDFSGYPNLSRWLESCEQLKGFTESHAMLSKMAPKFRTMIAKASEAVAKL